MSDTHKQHPSENPENPKKIVSAEGTPSSDAPIQHAAKATHDIAQTILQKKSEALKETQEVWSKLQHPGLLQEIKELSPEDKALINECAVDLVQGIRAQGTAAIFVSNTKQNGPVSDLKGTDEHHAYAVIPGGVKRSIELDKKLKADLLKHEPELLEAAVKEGDLYNQYTTWSAKILLHPENEKLAVLSMNTYVPRDQSFGDGKSGGARAVGCQILSVVPQTAKVLRLLTKHPEHARLLPFIMRNAAIVLRQKESLAHFDAPIGAMRGIMGEVPHTIYVADFRYLSLAKTTDARKATAQKKTYETTHDFAAATNLIGKQIYVRRMVQEETTEPTWFGMSERKVMVDRDKEVRFADANPPATEKDIELQRIMSYTIGSPWM